MPKVGSRRHRPVHIVCVVIASVTGLLSVVWLGGTIAAWAGQAGKPKATARILDISGVNRSSGHLVVGFTTGDGRRVRAEEKRRGWPSDVRQGADIEVVYDPDDPSDVQPFQDLKKALPPVAFFTIEAVASGAGAYRTRDTAPAAA